MPEISGVTNIDLSVIRADLPPLANNWSKCYVKIHVDGSTNALRTRPTKRAGQHEWGERFSLPAHSETILRFELKRKHLLRRQSLASVETNVQDLLPDQGEQDIPVNLRPSLEYSNVDQDHWRLFIRLHGMGNLPEVSGQRHFKTVEGCMAEIVSKLESFIAIGDAISELNPYAKVAWKAATAFYTIIKGQAEISGNLEDLAGLMMESYAFVEDIKSFPEKIPALDATIRALLAQTVECTMFLRECSGYGFGEKLAFGGRMGERIQGFMQSFASLKQSLETGTIVQAAFICFRLDENVNKLLNTQALLKLRPADMVDATRSQCLPNTRMDILTELFAWVTIPAGKSHVYWLYGFPGAGKSTIATSLANMFRDLRRLGAFVFFTRGTAARNDPSLLIPTLAYQLGEFDPRIGAAISRVIEEVPSIKQAPLHWQFQKLLVEPFASIGDCLGEGPILVVIDALDECIQSDGRKELLSVLASQSERLPPTIRIFITGRAERDIRSTFGAYSHIVVREIDINSTTNQEDIRTYIHHRMVDIRLQNEWLDLPSDWPGKARTEALALRASGLFVWASTACRYIANGQNPEERLAQLVQTELYADAESALDGIYTTALESAGRWDDAAFASDFRDILGLVIVAENPLTAHTIDLLNVKIEGKKQLPCLHTIRHLGAILQWAEDKPICVMHPSFADFITEKRRCRSDAWFIDRSVHHLRLATLCIARLGKTLKKNIGGLHLSTLGWKEELPEDVAYAARYWVDHLCNSVTHCDAAKADEFYKFLRVHFLHWIEAMTLMRKARQTIGLMIRLKEWVDSHYHADHEGFVMFAKDAARFCQAYTHVYEQHPLLVYQSALPFTPTATTIFQTFKDDPEMPVVVGGFREHWSPLLIEFGCSGANVAAISYSSDGRYIASTNTRSIVVWDSTSGEQVTKPMQADKTSFTTISFSPNNYYIASGSTEGAVRLWDALSGEQVGGALQKHSGPVYALVFSKDASLLVSGSKDQTIIIWNIKDGSMVHAPLAGHQKTILTLAFSPVRMQFASGSRDRSIRIWDAAVGEEVLPPIHHQGGGVTCLVYTPDGERIISASDDRSIRIWDAHKGELLYNPHSILQPAPLVLTSHKSDIFSIAISPDGALLASASKDTTVRLWDMSNYTELTHLVRQHRLSVHAVTFSPDGKRIVTASRDATVRVWDVESVGSMGATRLHKGLVSHLAFSADGTQIVSGGLDKMVRIWCAKSGQALIQPLRLELEVSVVAFDDGDGDGHHNHDASDSENRRGRGRILAVDKDGAVFAWDMATREPLMATPVDHPAAYARDTGRLALEGRWIVDKTATDGGTLSLLPNMSPAKARASHGNTIAIGLANGSIVIMRFPQ